MGKSSLPYVSLLKAVLNESFWLLNQVFGCVIVANRHIKRECKMWCEYFLMCKFQEVSYTLELTEEFFTLYFTVVVKPGFHSLHLILLC